MEHERNTNIRQSENSKKGRIPAFYAEEQKDREYAIKTSLFGRVTMVTVVTVFLGAGSDAKDRHAAGERGRDGLRRDDSTL